MIKKKLPILIITSLITLIPIVIGLILWDKLPEQAPIHWGVSGEVDAYTSKTEAVFMMPLLLFGLHWLCAIVTSLDPKNKNNNDKALNLFLWVVPIISLVCNSMVYVAALGHKVNANVIMPLFIGALFVVIGNYLPKCKQSYTIGIKIPWTLNDEENWNKTHRMAGFLWVIGGVIIMATAFLGIFWLFFVVLIPMVLIPFVYSYCLYKKNKTK